MASRKWSASDELLLQSLACGGTVKNAAVAAAVSERTAYRRLDDPAFVRRLDAIKAEYLDRSTRMLSACSIESVKTLVALQNQTVPERVRLGAAKAALTIGMKMREEQELHKRLHALEETFKTMKAQSERNHASTKLSDAAVSTGESGDEVASRQDAGPGLDSERSDGDLGSGGDET